MLMLCTLEEDRLVCQLCNSLGVGTVAARSELRLAPTLGLAAFTWVALPFVISQFCAVFVLRRMWRADRLADKIADAVKGLPPREQAAVAKRMIDEALK